MMSDELYEHEVEEENYFVSMTDMMVGLVFIFILLLMYYALQFRDVTEQLTGADRTRTEILEQLQSSLKEKGVDVTIDTQNGILRLPDAILFDSGKAELKDDGHWAVGRLSEALASVLPCYSDYASAAAVRPVGCPPTPHRIESLYIEGHADSDRLTGSGLLKDNWDLSVVRATNTFRELIAAKPDLTIYCAKKYRSCEPILSVSGYGPDRPIDPADTTEAKQKNRRIDLRIIMMTPDNGETATALREELEQQ